MRIRMKLQISGGRADGMAWPAAGVPFEVSAAEGAELCAAGLATPVTDEEPPETRPDKAPAEARVFESISAAGAAAAAAAQDAARATGGKSAAVKTVTGKAPAPASPPPAPKGAK